MANLKQRLQRLEDVRQTQEMVRRIRSLSDEELISFIKEWYQQLVSAGLMEEEIPKKTNE